MNLRFTPSAFALALTLSATSVALTNVDANAAGGGALADRFSDGEGEKKKDDDRRRAERMFPLLDVSNDAAAGGGGGFVAGTGGQFDAADAGILGLRRLHRNRPLFGGAIGRRSLQEKEEEEATCMKPDTCEPSLCNCTAAGGSGYDCAAELDALCNNVTAADGTLFTIPDCVSDGYIRYYYSLYCPFAKCVVDGGTKEECYCEFYKSACEIYDVRRYKDDEEHIMNCAIDQCCLDKTDDDGRAMCFKDAPTSSPSVAVSEAPKSSALSPSPREVVSAAASLAAAAAIWLN